MKNRYDMVLNWFKEYGFEVIKRSDSVSSWHRTIFKDKKGKIRIFEITNNNIWYIKRDRTSFGKTKTELYYNLDKYFEGEE